MKSIFCQKEREKYNEKLKEGATYILCLEFGSIYFVFYIKKKKGKIMVV